MNIKEKDGTIRELEITDKEFLAIVKTWLPVIRTRSSIVECEECGQRFIVNNQDFYQVTRCPEHRDRRIAPYVLKQVVRSIAGGRSRGRR